MKTRRLLAARAFVLAFASLGCSSDPAVTFEVTLPSALGPSTAWIEVGAYAGACPPASELAAGLPAEGLLARLAFAPTDPTPPAIGALTKGSYAFLATARGSNCGVLASGCTSVDLTSARDISIALSPTSGSAGACEVGSACLDAECVPATPAFDAAAPAVCALTFVGAGPLGDPMETATDVVSAPAAAATDAGFLVVYREYDPAGGTAQMTGLAIDPSGALTVGAPAALPDQCANQTETDGVGLAFAEGTGLAVSARPACGTRPAGIDFLTVSAAGSAAPTGFSASAQGQPVLSGGHALTFTSADTGWLAYATPRSAELAAVSGSSFRTPSPFGIGAPASVAQVAASGRVLALLSGDTPGADAGAATPALGVALGEGGADAGVPFRFAGDWGALALSGGRAIVVSDSQVTSQPVAWHIVDTTLASALSATFSTPGAGPASGADVAFVGTSAVFAVEQQGSISLVAFDHATSTPTLGQSVLLSADARVPSQASVHDGKVAIAASANEILVTWVTGTTLGPADRLGGWALYSCAP